MGIRVKPLPSTFSVRIAAMTSSLPRQQSYYTLIREHQRTFQQLTSDSKMVGSKHEVVIHGTRKQREDKDDLQNAEG